MGSGGSKGGASDENALERETRCRRSTMQGFSCFCFSSSVASDHDKEIERPHRRKTSKCLQCMFPCHGRIINSPSPDTDDETSSSSSSSSSFHAATIIQNSSINPSREERIAGTGIRTNNFERRPIRRNGFQDPFEGSVRFSRTLSVGRLRDRVLRRSSYLDGSNIISDIIGRGGFNPTVNSNGSDDYHQSMILERRMRLRSQVWALQRLGNRVERNSNGTEESNSRSSISRIVMLAEALFEVLDEIHQQAVVMASRPSVSAIGSVPAPREVVEEIPLRVYRKEEALQCYICLEKYEEGEKMRVLPCGHEFHQSCVDKWLKEIHRVCPLCRADVCLSEISQTEKLGCSL